MGKLFFTEMPNRKALYLETYFVIKKFNLYKNPFCSLCLRLKIDYTLKSFLNATSQIFEASWLMVERKLKFQVTTVAAKQSLWTHLIGISTIEAVFQNLSILWVKQECQYLDVPCFFFVVNFLQFWWQLLKKFSVMEFMSEPMAPSGLLFYSTPENSKELFLSHRKSGQKIDAFVHFLG